MSRVTRRSLIAAGLASSLALTLPSVVAAQSDTQIVNVVTPEGEVQAFSFWNFSQTPGTVTFKWGDQERQWLVDAGVSIQLREGFNERVPLTISRSSQIGARFYTYDDNSLIYCHYGAEPGQPITFERKDLSIPSPTQLRWREDHDEQLAWLDSLFFLNMNPDREVTVDVRTDTHLVGTYAVPSMQHFTVRFDGWMPGLPEATVTSLEIGPGFKIGYHESDQFTYRAWGRTQDGNLRIFTNKPYGVSGSEHTDRSSGSD